MSDVKIITLLPTRGFVLTEVETALDSELAANRQMPVILRTHDLPLPLSRNFLVETALKQDWWTHALLLDDDVILPKGAIKDMLKQKTDIAVMDYPMQQKVEGQFCGTVCHDKDGTVAFAGLGAVLVKREVFEGLVQPWFVATAFRTNRTADGTIGFYQGQDANKTIGSAGEDTYFYLQARKHGFKVKECKLTATHCRVDRVVTITHNNRYAQQHQIAKLSEIERELI